MMRAVLATLLFATTSLFSEPGQTICSPSECYLLEEELGKGAFGRVFSATDSSGTKRAIKAYMRYEGEEREIMALFRSASREFERGALLDHEHVVKSIELFPEEAEESPYTDYLVLQYIEGNPLWRLERGEITREEALRACSQLLDALQYGLTQNMIHLDLHGGNVMVTGEHDLMVIDLGSFFFLDELGDLWINHNPSDTTLLTGLITESTEEDSAPEHGTVVREAFAKAMALKKEESLTKEEATLDAKNAFLPGYVDSITNLCIQILKKAPLEKEDQLTLSAKIKRISWEYDYDVEENNPLPIEKYFEQLKNLFLFADKKEL